MEQKYVSFYKGDKIKLPQSADINTDGVYVGIADSETDYSLLIVGGKEWRSFEYTDSIISQFITTEEFADTQSKADTAVQPDALKTVNSESLIGEGDITIDLTLFVIVAQLPTENINPHKIYLVQNTSVIESNRYDEYLYDEITQQWELIGIYTSEIKLDGYIKQEDADKRYVRANSSSNASISVSTNGSFNNYGNNGQAFNAVRDVASSSLTGYPINAASFGVKLDGTTAFSHKKYTTFDPATGAYTGAKNTAVLTFSGNTGLRYAKNTGAAGDVTEDMFKYVGVIDSPDVKQRVYSSTQVDTLITKIKAVLTSLGATQEQIDSITI